MAMTMTNLARAPVAAATPVGRTAPRAARAVGVHTRHEHTARGAARAQRMRCRGGNGSGSDTLSRHDLDVRNIDGARFVSLEQTTSALANADAAVREIRDEVTALQRTVEDLRGQVSASEGQREAREREARERTDMIDALTKAVGHLSAERDAAVAQRDAVSKEEAAIVGRAVERLHSTVSQAYVDTKDRQLHEMARSVESAVAAAADAQAEKADGVASARGEVDAAVRGAVNRLDSEASAATRKARAEASTALAAARDASDSAARIGSQHAATAALARSLHAEAQLAISRAEGAHAEAAALAAEVASLRGDLHDAAGAVDAASDAAAAAEREARERVAAVSMEAEGRVTEMYHAFESLKYNEREGARIARDEAGRLSEALKRAEEAAQGRVDREREMRDALAAATARAHAAEESAVQQVAAMEDAFATATQLYKQEADARAEAATAAASATAQEEAQREIAAALADSGAASEGAATERASLQAALDVTVQGAAYWKQRAERAEIRTQAVYEDVRELARNLPSNLAAISQLKLRSSELRALLTSGPAAFESSVSDATKSIGDAPDWLPPSIDAAALPQHSD